MTRAKVRHFGGKTLAYVKKFCLTAQKNCFWYEVRLLHGVRKMANVEAGEGATFFNNGCGKKDGKYPFVSHHVY